MALVAYIRVSTVGQNLEVQRDRVLAHGVESDHIFEEKKSGVDSGRPALKEALRFVRTGDTFVVTKIDRLARSAADLHRIVKELEQKGVKFRVLDQNVDTDTPTGKLLLGVLALIAEFETEIRKERQMDGIAKAKETGVKFGRKAKVDQSVIDTVTRMRAEGKLIKDIMAETGLSKATVYRVLSSTPY
ncbi:recombinase family protein [Brucella anthropi]|uniref:Recombinase family protein n=1 Tax=Brucella anthropi TaxID=529 RepID=A0A6L3YYY1_BRUAN|nr:recombinase family protein [Brucella anthropi]KAB2760941.1 recombinase family protein [Brucella anthropi]UVV66955.1 recombinase family protein [Brucella anthropi]